MIMRAIVSILTIASFLKCGVCVNLPDKKPPAQFRVELEERIIDTPAYDRAAMELHKMKVNHHEFLDGRKDTFI